MFIGSSDDERHEWSSAEAYGYDGVRAIYAVPIPIDDAFQVDGLLATGRTERRPDQTSFTKRWQPKSPGGGGSGGGTMFEICTHHSFPS